VEDFRFLDHLLLCPLAGPAWLAQWEDLISPRWNCGTTCDLAQMGPSCLFLCVHVLLSLEKTKKTKNQKKHKNAKPKNYKKMHYSYISFFGGSLLLSLEKTKKIENKKKQKKCKT